MEKKVKRIYKEFGVSFVFICHMMLILFELLLPVLGEDIEPIWMVCSVPVIVILIITIAIGYYSPIRLSQTGVKYRKVFISWEQVEIVLVPVKRGFYPKPIYYMVFCEREMNYEELKKLILFKGRWVYLFDRNINSILPYYDKPFKVLDYNGRYDCIEGEMAEGRKRLNKIVNDHNAKYKQD